MTAALSVNETEISQGLKIEIKESDYGSTHSLENSKSIIYCVHGRETRHCDEDHDNLDIQKGEISHCHQERQQGVDKVARKKLIIACCLCTCFMLVEIVGGVWSNSLAIATDAAHLLADLGAFLISLFAIWLTGRPATKRLSFGWYRAEVIGALVSVLAIWLVTAILFYMAVIRVVENKHEVEGEIMLITSSVGILVNIIMILQLHDFGHGHGHSHSSKDESHSHSSISSKQEGHSHVKQTNMNIRAAIIHVIGDLVQSIGVFIAALVIYFKPEWSIIDPICTFLFSILVLLTTIKIMNDALLVLMEGTPKYLDYAEFMQIFMQIDGVVRVHNLRIWALSINNIALSAHLAVEPNTNTERILREATKQVHNRYQFFETTLQIEEFQPDMEDCNQCTNPL